MSKTKRSRRPAPRKSTSLTQRTGKTTSQPVSRQFASTKKVLSVFNLARLRRFFEQRRNVVAVLVVLIVFGLLYLLKDVFIVAVVNGQPIYRWTVISKLEQQGGQQVLDSLVTETLVRQAVKKVGIIVSQEEIDAQIAGIEERLTAQGFTLDQALAQEGMTRTELIDQIKLQSAVDQLTASEVIVTEEQIDQYIADNQEFLPAELTGEALRAEVRQQLQLSAVSQATQTWIQDLQAEAQIMYLRDYGGQSL
ncbi:MAG TPA: SurA N-terminal domain-containing protein [Patescibacteria group bacterium]|jgi:parvulin-like peptidyl-prolyl isomerase